MRNILILFGILLAGPAWADVYRSTDKEGNAIFTDRPAPGAEKVQSRPVNAIAGPRIAPSGTASRPAVKLSDQYESLAITQPANDEQLRENEGKVTVQIAVQPGLKPGDVLTLTLDGAKAGAGSQTSFTLSDVERGTHALEAVVRNAQGKEVARSAKTTFHLQRFSTLHPGALQQIQRQATGGQQQASTLPTSGQPAQQAVPTPGGTGLPAAQVVPSAAGPAVAAPQVSTLPPAGGAAVPPPQVIPPRN